MANSPKLSYLQKTLAGARGGDEGASGELRERWPARHLVWWSGRAGSCELEENSFQENGDGRFPHARILSRGGAFRGGGEAAMPPLPPLPPQMPGPVFVRGALGDMELVSPQLGRYSATDNDG